MKYLGRQYRWFHNRIGKRIFSPPFPEGIVVENRDHAFDLWTIDTYWHNEKEFKKHE